MPDMGDNSPAVNASMDQSDPSAGTPSAPPDPGPASAQVAATPQPQPQAAAPAAPTPQPAQPGAAPAPKGLLMINQGKSAYVPLDKVDDAIAMGAEPGVRMTASDGKSKAIVPFSKQDEAQKENGATWQAHPDNDAVKQYMTQKQAMDQDKTIGPEEKAFLKSNKGYQYKPADPKFPNRPPGIYPVGPGNEWRDNPDTAQEPVDLHLLKHTAESAATSAVAVGGGAVGAEALEDTMATRALMKELGIDGDNVVSKVVKPVIEHLKQPGKMLNFPYGRAVEYYMLHKIGYGAGKLMKIAQHLPVE
jgi:hypothetical protein